MDNAEKKQKVTLFLKEMERVIHKCVDEGRAEEYSPFDLVHVAIHEIQNLIMEEQVLDEAFEKIDDSGKTNS